MEPHSFAIPPAIARVNAALPQAPAAAALCLALNLARGRVFPAELLRAMEDKHLQLRVLDAGFTLDFTARRGWFVPRPAGTGAPDLVISAAAHDFVRLALRQDDPDTLFFARRLLMQGDTELGLLVKNTMDAAEWVVPTLADLAPHRVARRLVRYALARRP